MPHYYIDTDDNTSFVEDERGSDFLDREVARRQALSALADMVSDFLPDGDSREFKVRVRDAQGAVIYQAALIVRGSWVD